VRVDFTFLAEGGISPIVEAPRSHAAENQIELLVVHEERIVLGLELLVRLEDRERDLVRGLDIEKGAERHGIAEAEHLRIESSRRALVARVHEGVVELDGHGAPARSFYATLGSFAAGSEQPDRDDAGAEAQEPENVRRCRATEHGAYCE
jgi:hypothetical protein